MGLIDTHTHVYGEQFYEDIEAVMQRVTDNGIDKICLPNIDLESIPQMHQLMEQFPGQCAPMMGLHPCSVGDDYKEVLAKIKEELDSKDYIAVGEIGIDLYWDKTTLPQQIDAFRTQIEWSIEKDLPICIHCRDSFDEIFEVLEDYRGKVKGIFHCFSGNVEQGKFIKDLGLYLGIGGVVTFKNAGLDKVISALGIEKLVLETDAPYLTPAPHRGKRNEPSYTLHIAEKLASIFEIGLDEVTEITTNNAKNAFPKAF